MAATYDDKQQPDPITHQPTTTPSMAPSSAPLAAALMTKGPVSETGEFSSGLCDCEAGPFCVSFWCPCFTYGENKQRLRSLNERGQPLPKDQIEGVGSDNVLFCAVNCATSLGCLLDYVQRTNIRTRYGMQHGAVKDFFISWCCLPCSQQQQSRELAREEDALFATHGLGPGGAQPSLGERKA